MDTLHQVTLYYLLAANVVTFVVYGIDKLKAKRGRWRISEAALLVLAVVGGSVGAWVGMKLWHHKTLHKKFSIGVPLIIFLQVALAVYLHISQLIEESPRSLCANR